MSDYLDNEQKQPPIPDMEPTKEAKTSPTPTLTLDPFGQESASDMLAHMNTQVQQVDSVSDIKVDISQFTDEEQRMIDDFANRIDITDTNLVLQFGAGAQKKLADFSEKALDNVRTKDMGEVGNMLSDVVVELKEFDPDNEKKGVFGFFNKGKAKMETLKVKYDKAEANVDKIADRLEEHQIRLLKDTALLDQMYELNTTYFKELSMYILAGKKKLNEVRNQELPALQRKAEVSGLPEDAQAVRDLVSFCDRFEKKLYDLQLSRMLSIQTAPQLRLLQSSNTVMVDKIQTTLVNTIPLWKSQMVIALGLNHATQAAKAQQAVSNMTNELLRKNAEALHQATVETARESNRGIVDMETLRDTNQKLIQTFDEVLQIQQEGREKRAAAEREMMEMEAELKQKLLDIKRN